MHGLSKYVRFSWTIIVLIIFSYLVFLMIKICLSYFPWSNTAHFLILKQDVIDNHFWRFAFQIHVVISSLVLLAGFTQFFEFIRIRYPKLHRSGGWLYILTTLIFALPSGMVLAFSANGGWITQLCFVLLGLLWGMSTMLALYYAYQQKWIIHRDWMIRSFALALSALSLRTWKIILYAIQPYADWLTPLYIYQLEAWLGWVINLIIAEWIILRLHRRKSAL